MPNQPKTPNRVIRVDDELWSDYGEACEAEGTTRSDDLRAHMLRKVRAQKRKMAADGQERSAEQSSPHGDKMGTRGAESQGTAGNRREQ